jgi:hypothetical protein
MNMQRKSEMCGQTSGINPRYQNKKTWARKRFLAELHAENSVTTATDIPKFGSSQLSRRAAKACCRPTLDLQVSPYSRFELNWLPICIGRV